MIPLGRGKVAVEYNVDPEAFYLQQYVLFLVLHESLLYPSPKGNQISVQISVFTGAFYLFLTLCKLNHRVWTSLGLVSFRSGFFWVWTSLGLVSFLFSFNIMFVRVTIIDMRGNGLFCFFATQYSIIWVCHKSLIFSILEEHLDCFSLGIFHVILLWSSLTVFGVHIFMCIC